MRTLLEEVRAGGLPRHVAIIMDGNGRWADARGLPRTAGHHAGALAAERLIRFLGAQLPIPYVTLFAFSSENWSRPQAEVTFLMELLGDFIHARIAEFADAGIASASSATSIACLPPCDGRWRRRSRRRRATSACTSPSP